MLSKIQVKLDNEEFDSLYRLARAELRTPADQARYLLRKVLATEGALSSTNSPQKHVAAVTGNGGGNGK